MKAKTQMGIGFWGVVLFLFYTCHLLIMPLSLNEIFGWLFFSTFYVLYILSIIKKDLKSAKNVFYIWLIPALSILCMSVVFSIIHGVNIEKFVIFLYFLINTCIMWIGIGGLKRVIETESE